MKKLLIILMVLATLLGVVACSPSDTPDGYTLVSREDEIFNLYVPSSWQDNSESGISGAYSSLGSTVMAIGLSSNRRNWVPPAIGTVPALPWMKAAPMRCARFLFLCTKRD